jgi:hypothetical protein
MITDFKKYFNGGNYQLLIFLVIFGKSSSGSVSEYDYKFNTCSRAVFQKLSSNNKLKYNNYFKDQPPDLTGTE